MTEPQFTEDVRGHWVNYQIDEKTANRGMFNHVNAPLDKTGSVKIWIFKLPKIGVLSGTTTCRVMVRRGSHGYWEAFIHMDMYHDDNNDTSWWNSCDVISTNPKQPLPRFALIDRMGQPITTIRTRRKDLMADVERTVALIYTPPRKPVEFNMNPSW
jgi:hypothetical protein